MLEQQVFEILLFHFVVVNTFLVIIFTSIPGMRLSTRLLAIAALNPVVMTALLYMWGVFSIQEIITIIKNGIPHFWSQGWKHKYLMGMAAWVIIVLSGLAIRRPGGK